MQKARILAAVAICALSLIVSGCSSKKDSNENSKPATPTSGKAPATGADQPATPPAGSRPKAIAEKQVRALLDTWLAAQNGGDFASYEGLYAKRLEGVRRSGAKVVRFDRAGWLKDRKRMFKRKMNVEVSDTKIDVFSQSAIISFTQRWASGRYEDIGPKQLVVVREGERVRIAREEMLSSTLLGDAKKTKLADDSFLFVISVADKQYAILDRLKGADVGALSLLDKGTPVSVSGAVSVQKLPVSVSGWQGQKLESGSCTGTVGELVAMSRVVPHFGEVQTWSGNDGEYEAFTEAQIAKAGFYKESAYLVGTLTDTSCAFGQFARLAGTPAPAVGKPMADGARKQAIVAAATTAFNGLKSFEKLQKEYANDFGGSGSWVDDEDSSGLNIAVIEHPTKGAVQVLAQAHSRLGCGDFGGKLTAHFTVSGSERAPKLKLIKEGAVYPKVLTFLDVDGDGQLEYLSEDFMDTALTAWNGDVKRSIAIPFFDCGC